MKRRALLAVCAAGLLAACQAGSSATFWLPRDVPSPLPQLAQTQPPAALGHPGAAGEPAARPDPIGVGAIDPGLGQRAVVASAAGRVADPLRLDEVLASVTRDYPLLSVAVQERRIARAQELAALGAFDLRWVGSATSNALGFYRNETLGLRAEQPVGALGADLEAGYRTGTGDFDPTFDGKRQTNRGGEFFAGARVPLLRDSGIDGRRRDLRNAALGRDVADAQARELRIRVAREAADAYWRWVAAGRRLSVVDELFALAGARQEGIATRVRQGDLPEIEQLDNERLVVGRRAMQIAAERALERSAIALSLFLRGADGTPLRPTRDRLPERIPAAVQPQTDLLDGDVRRALGQRPQLSALDAVRQTLRIDRDYFANQRLPRLDFRIDGSQDLSRDDPSRTKGEFELFMALDVGIETQNRRATGRLLEVDSRIKALDHRLSLLRDQISAEVRDGFSELVATHARALQTARAADLAKRVAAGERRRYALGDSTILVLNLREEAAGEADLRVIEALSEYWIAVARYRAAVGEDPLGDPPD